MKMKWIAAALAALLLLSGCNGNIPQQTDPTTNEASIDGITVSVLSAEHKEKDTVLEVQWKNESPYFVMYGEVFGIQIFDGNQWVDCETKEDTAFHTIGYGLEAGKSTVVFYQLAWRYGDLKTGRYRFITSCTATVNGHDQPVSLCAEFSLEGETPEANQPHGVYTKPPKLIIHGVADAVLGGYSWSYYLYDDTWAHEIADARHPLQMVDDLQIINLKTNRVEFFFEDWPDDYTVRCWRVDGTPEDGPKIADSESVLVWNNSIQLKENNYIYEVTATWNDDGEGYYGTATYVFYPSYPSSQDYGVMPIPTTS